SVFDAGLERAGRRGRELGEPEVGGAAAPLAGREDLAGPVADDERAAHLGLAHGDEAQRLVLDGHLGRREQGDAAARLTDRGRRGGGGRGRRRGLGRWGCRGGRRRRLARTRGSGERGGEEQGRGAHGPRITRATGRTKLVRVTAVTSAPNP